MSNCAIFCGLILKEKKNSVCRTRTTHLNFGWFSGAKAWRYIKIECKKRKKKSCIYIYIYIYKSCNTLHPLYFSKQYSCFYAQDHSEEIWESVFGSILLFYWMRNSMTRSDLIVVSIPLFI